MQERRELWSGRIGFILSNIGAAIGLGSIWKFPYEVGTNGGGAFLLFYLLGLAFVVLPLMLVEFAVGRRGQSDAVASVAAVAAECGASKRWGLIGTLGITTSFLILSFYSVIGGWALYYVVETTVFGSAGNTAAEAQARFDSMLASPILMSAYHAAFMAITALIVARGIAHGIETACTIFMPALIVLIIVLAFYAMSQGDTYAALRFPILFRPGVGLAKSGAGGAWLGIFLNRGRPCGHDHLWQSCRRRT